MIDLNKKWQNWFLVESDNLGFEVAYMRLKSHVKFHNYHDNSAWWCDDAIIKYSADENVLPEIIGCATIANNAIKKMMVVEA